MTIGDQDLLKDKIVWKVRNPDNDQRISFVVGSGLTRGPVPGVAEYVRKFRRNLDTSEARTRFDTSVAGTKGAEAYQRAAAYIELSKDRNFLTRLVRLGVLQACTGLSSATKNRLVRNEIELADLELDPSIWNLTPGVESFGELLVNIPRERRGIVLTTNFDPLIEVAVRKAGGQARSQWLEGDGRIAPWNMHNEIHVIHMHGFWSQGNTLHTEWQLTRPRPVLEGSVRDALTNSFALVCGYGGWKDTFTRSLLDRVREQNDLRMEYAWSWHSTLDESDFSYGIRAELKNIGSVFHYAGVDLNSFFPDLAAEVKRLSGSAGP
ncbi:SIR2 family protein [Streptomyces sp. NPDC059371]|uniref:SIR2 family protein n=1 Tax=Streptomyces sp. NPDC059371 TaxID=3346812 RepID=UPI0036A25F8E